MIVFVGINIVAVGTSDAYRQKVFRILKNDDTGSVHLDTDKGYDLIGQWTGYWYPSYIPESFALYDAENDSNSYYMLFTSENGNDKFWIAEYPADTEFSYDADTQANKSVKVGSQDGLYFSDQENETYILVWLTDRTVIELRCEGDFSESEVMEIAEKMELVK